MLFYLSRSWLSCSITLPLLCPIAWPLFYSIVMPWPCLLALLLPSCILVLCFIFLFSTISLHFGLKRSLLIDPWHHPLNSFVQYFYLFSLLNVTYLKKGVVRNTNDANFLGCLA